MAEKILQVVAKPDDFERQHKTDAGFDIRVPHDVDLYAGRVTVVTTDVKVAIPKDCVGILAVRSSVGARGIAIAGGIGVIDSGYRGKIKLPLISYNTSQTIFAGERVAQLLVMPLQPVKVKFVDKLPESDRGENGLGSTGRA